MHSLPGTRSGAPLLLADLLHWNCTLPPIYCCDGACDFCRMFQAPPNICPCCASGTSSLLRWTSMAMAATVHSPSQQQHSVKCGVARALLLGLSSRLCWAASSKLWRSLASAARYSSDQALRVPTCHWPPIPGDYRIRMTIHPCSVSTMPPTVTTRLPESAGAPFTEPSRRRCLLWHRESVRGLQGELHIFPSTCG
jgi:hypothetical protein